MLNTLYYAVFLFLKNHRKNVLILSIQFSSITESLYSKKVNASFIYLKEKWNTYLRKCALIKI